MIDAGLIFAGLAFVALAFIVGWAAGYAGTGRRK